MNERNSPENFSLRVGESEKYIDCLESRSNGEFHAAVFWTTFDFDWIPRKQVFGKTLKYDMIYTRNMLKFFATSYVSNS